MVSTSAGRMSAPHLFLLPTAPPELAEEVYDHVVHRLAQAPNGDDALHRRAFALRGAHEAAPVAAVSAQADARAHRPWELLHVEPDAPPEIVELAYRFWARTVHDHPTGERDETRPKRSPQRLLAGLAGRLQTKLSGWPAAGRATAGPTAPVVVEDVAARAEAEIAFDVAPPIALVGEPQPVPALLAPSDATPRLVDGAGAAIVIAEHPLRIGTDPTCDVVVATGAKGGPVEARLWSYDGRVVLHGVAGRALVLVNGEPLAWAVLDHGDRIDVGDRAFSFQQA